MITNGLRLLENIPRVHTRTRRDHMQTVVAGLGAANLDVATCALPCGSNRLLPGLEVDSPYVGYAIRIDKDQASR